MGWIEEKYLNSEVNGNVRSVVVNIMFGFT